jgi:CHAD domain-containing protein
MKSLPRGRSGTKGVQRIVLGEIDAALERLKRPRAPADTTIHDARKRLKRARAALRLARGSLGKRQYRDANAAMRDAARPLSEVRDAKMLLATFDALLAGAPPRERRGASRLRPVLMAHQADIRRRVLGRKVALKPVVGALDATRKRLAHAPFGNHGWSVLGPGIRRVYRAGRAAFENAARDPSANHLHEWRKQAKYLWHQIQILEPIRPSALAKRAKSIHELSDRLGGDHDLVVLRQQVANPRARLARAARATMIRLIEARRAELQKEALALGAQLYLKPPKRFEEELARWWRSWRARGR